MSPVELRITTTRVQGGFAGAGATSGTGVADGANEGRAKMSSSGLKYFRWSARNVRAASAAGNPGLRDMPLQTLVHVAKCAGRPGALSQHFLLVGDGQKFCRLALECLGFGLDAFRGAQGHRVDCSAAG